MKVDLDEMVDEYATAHATAAKAMGAPANPVSAVQAKATLADIVAKLRAKGINWTSILTVIGPILSMIFSGTPAGPIITAILAILQGGVPTGAAGS